MVNQFYTISLLIVIIVTQLYVFLSFMECKLDSKKEKVILFGLISFLGIATCTGVAMFPNLFLIIFLIGMVIPSFFVMLWASKYKNMKFVVTYCLSVLSIGLLDLFGYMSGILIFSTYTNFWVWLSRCIIVIAGSLLFTFFLKQKYRSALESINKGWGILVLVSVTEYLIMIMLPNYPTEINERREYIPQALIFIVFLFLVLILMIIMISNYVLAEQRKSEKEVVAAQLDDAHLQFKILNENIETTKIYQHHLRRHVYFLYNMCKNKKYDKLRRYLESTVNKIDKPLPIYSKNYIVDVILGYYSFRAKELGIKFNIESDIPDNINIKDDQLTSLLGNALSNAFDECKMIKSGEKQIDVFVSLKQNTLLLWVKNTFLNNQLNKGALVSKEGKDHSIGISSMRRIAEENSGILKCKIEDNIFSLKVVVPV